MAAARQLGGTQTHSQSARGRGRSTGKGRHLKLVSSNVSDVRSSRNKTTGKRRRRGMEERAVRTRGRLAAVGALGLGGMGVAAASVIGVGELLVGGFVAYVVYRMIRYGVPPAEAIMEGVELERGEIPRRAWQRRSFRAA